MKLSSFLNKINLKNLDKPLQSFDKGMAMFNKCMQQFLDSMDSITKEFLSDIEKSNKKSKSEAMKNQRNIDKLWGKLKSNAKIWSDRGKSSMK